MTAPPQRPETIERLGRAVYPSLAMLAGMELDLFTPLRDGPMTPGQLADALEVNAGKLRPLLYSLVAAGLLEVVDERFSNVPESQKFLVRDSPDYLGGRRYSLLDDGTRCSRLPRQSRPVYRRASWTTQP